MLDEIAAKATVMGIVGRALEKSIVWHGSKGLNKADALAEQRRFDQRCGV